MATATVSNTIKSVGAVAVEGATVIISLLWDSGSPVAKSDDDDFIFQDAITLTTDSDGNWSQVFITNDSIDPADSVYKIVESTTTDSNTYYIFVPSTDDSYWAGDLIVNAPSGYSET